MKGRLRSTAPTKRQLEIFAFIKACPHEPSLREIGEAVGLSSASTVRGHILRLRDLRHLAPAERNTIRSIRIADDHPDHPDAPLLNLARTLADRHRDDDHKLLVTMLERQLRSQP